MSRSPTMLKRLTSIVAENPFVLICKRSKWDKMAVRKIHKKEKKKKMNGIMNAKVETQT